MALKKEATKKELFVKYWFVLFVAVLFIAFIGLYSVNSFKNRKIYVNEKIEDDKYVIFTIDGKNYYADDLYESSYNDLAKSKLYDSFIRFMLDKTIETTDDMKLMAKNYEAYYLQQSQATQEELETFLLQNGFNGGLDDLKAYYINYLKTTKLLTDYLINHYDEEAQPFLEEEGYKAVSHILIKVANVEETTVDSKKVHTAKPTDEETAKLNEVLEALKTRSFEDVAKEYSEDTSKDQGGFLGYVSKEHASETYVTEFADAVKTLEDNVISDVITTQYGYHIILVHTPTKDEIIKNMNEETTIPLAIYEHHQDVLNKAIVEISKDLKYTVNDEKLNEALEIKEESEEKEDAE